jgi:hypothetical protein
MTRMETGLRPFWKWRRRWCSVAKRAELTEERLKGLEAVFGGAKVIKPEKPKTSKTEKQKVTFYLDAEAVELLEDLRLKLRREHGFGPRASSKSAIVEAALRLAEADLAGLAKALRPSK